MKLLEILEDLSDAIFGDKRVDALQHFAKHQGFKFRRKVNPDLLPLEVQRLDLFSQNRKKSRSIKGFLHKQETKPNILGQIFDYGIEGSTSRTTVYLMQSKQLDLPPFKIEPKSHLSRLNVFTSKSEWSDVDRDFGSKYEVTSDDLNTMRMLITIQFAEVVNELDEYTIEGVDDYLLIYQPKHQEDIIRMDNIYGLAVELADIILHDHSNELV
jgi:hypothetical protein